MDLSLCSSSQIKLCFRLLLSFLTGWPFSGQLCLRINKSSASIYFLFSWLELHSENTKSKLIFVVAVETCLCHPSNEVLSQLQAIKNIIKCNQYFSIPAKYMITIVKNKTVVIQLWYCSSIIVVVTPLRLGFCTLACLCIHCRQPLWVQRVLLSCQALLGFLKEIDFCSSRSVQYQKNVISTAEDHNRQKKCKKKQGIVQGCQA